jgi:hypothetical protein
MNLQKPQMQINDVHSAGDQMSRPEEYLETHSSPEHSSKTLADKAQLNGSLVNSAAAYTPNDEIHWWKLELLLQLPKVLLLSI